MSLPYPSLRQGLVGAWCPSLGASGLSLIDRSGRGSHGTLVAPSANSWSASGDGLSVAFDGTQGATLPFSATFGNSATLSLWVKRINQTSPTIADSGFFVANLPDGGQQSHYPYQGFIYCRLLRTNRVNGLTTLIDLTQWHNFCVTTDGTNYTIYQAGRILSQTAAESTVKLASPLRVVELFRGNIDDVRLYNRALTLSEIRLLASRRGIGLRHAQHYDDDADLQQYPITTPPNRLHANVAGVWVPGQVRANTAGTWGNGETRVNQGGEWL